MPSNPTLLDRRRLKTAQMERKIATTSFLILRFLIISIIPYFIAVLLHQTVVVAVVKLKWLFALRESLVVFLFLNSAINPFLTAFRINELMHSVKIVLGLRTQHGLSSSGNFLPPTSVGNVGSL